MTTAIASLMEEPDLPEVFGAIKARLEEERALRLRFYGELTPSQKAEFINGKVIMHSPATYEHNETRQNVEHALLHFVRARDLGAVVSEKALCVFPRNDYEPDVCFFTAARAAKFKRITTKFPPPDFICEVLSKSTEALDRGIKFKDYAAHGVREYWIADPRTQVLEQYVSDGKGGYRLHLKSGSGDVASTVIKGLRIPIRALFDAKANAAALKKMF
jgi:Uma2 family endonuclease